MIVSILVLVFCLSSATAEQIPITAKEVTSSSVKFNYVRTMIPHPGDPALLVVTDAYSVWTYDPVKNIQWRIAGSTTAGYTEATGTDARFYSLFGSAPFNKTSVVVTDYEYDCVRRIGLGTHRTERYAGVCNSAGSTDTSRLSAKFRYPYGITRVGPDFYVCDSGNSRIRKISNNVVSTVLSTTSPQFISSSNTKLFYIYSHRIAEFDLETSKNKYLTQSSSGFVDGSVNVARFSSPHGNVPLTEDILVVADRGNKALRLINLTNQTVSTLGSTSIGSSSIFSVSVHDGNIYVGRDDGRILAFSVMQIPGLAENIRCGTDQRLTIPASDYKTLFQPEVVNTTSIICNNCPTVQNLTVGVHQFSYQFTNFRSVILNSCNQTIVVNAEVSKPKCGGDKTVTLPIGEEFMNVTLTQPDVSGTRLQCISCPPSYQVLLEGSHKISFIYQDKLTKNLSSCSYTVKVMKPAGPAITKLGKPVCPEDTIVILPVGEEYMNVTLSRPDVNGTALECLSCPPTERVLFEGLYNITYIYRNSLTRDIAFCSYLVKVIKPDAPACHNRTKDLYLKKNQDTIKQVEQEEIELRLKAGVTVVRIADDCYHTYIVHDWSAMERRAFLQAEYRFDCQSLSELSYSVIRSDAKHHTRQLQHFCPDCKVNAPVPIVECLDDTLLITWQTDFTRDQKTVPDEMRKELENHLTNFQLKYPGMGISVIDIVPRVASPVRQDSGLYLKVLVRTSCLVEGYAYDESSDLCKEVTVSTVEVQCPSDMEIVLPASIDRQNVTLPQPDVDWNRLECIECPPLQREVKAGSGNITFIFRDKMTNETTSCSYHLNVRQIPKPACFNETKYVFLNLNQTRTDEIQIGDFTIRLDVGVHVIKIEDGCYVTYVVNEKSVMEKTVFLESQYLIKCSTLTKISFSVIDSYLAQHTQYLRTYCPVCQVNAPATVNCTNDTLTASWMTAITGNHQVKDEEITKKLHGALVQFQAKYPIMDITVVTTIPRIISPVKDDAGLNVHVVIKSSCLNEAFSFNKKYDVCMKPN